MLRRGFPFFIPTWAAGNAEIEDGGVKSFRDEKRLRTDLRQIKHWWVLIIDLLRIDK